MGQYTPAHITGREAASPHGDPHDGGTGSRKQRRTSPPLRQKCVTRRMHASTKTQRLPPPSRYRVLRTRSKCRWLPD